MELLADIRFFIPEDIPKTFFLVRSGGSLLRLSLTGFLADAHSYPFLSEAAWTLVELVLQQSDVPENALNVLVVFYHLLVMAAALVGRTRLYMQAEHLVYLQRSAIFLGRLKKLPVLLQKAHVVQVLLQSPEGFIEPPLFPSQFSTPLVFRGKLKGILLLLLHAQGLQLQKAQEEALVVEAINNFHFFRFP